jgi:hypothetical protein
MQPDIEQSLPESQKIDDEVVHQRRKALKKLGKYSVYASPVVLGVVSQKAVAVSLLTPPIQPNISEA